MVTCFYSTAKYNRRKDLYDAPDSRGILLALKYATNDNSQLINIHSLSSFSHVFLTCMKTNIFFVVFGPNNDQFPSGLSLVVRMKKLCILVYPKCAQ